MARSILGGNMHVDAPDASESFFSIAGGMAYDATSETSQVVAWPTGIATNCVSAFSRLAVYIEANACDQDSVFNFRVDTLDTTLEVTVPAGETGWFLPVPLGPHDATVGMGGPGHPDRNLVVRLNKPGTGLLRVGAVYLLHDLEDLGEAVSAAGTVMVLRGVPYSGYGGFPGDYEVRLVGSYEDQDPPVFRHYMRTAGKAHRLRVNMTGNSRDVDLVVSLAVNGVATALSITIPHGDTSPTIYVDVDHAVDLVEGDGLSLLLSNTGWTSGSTGIHTWDVIVETPGPEFDFVTGANPGYGFVSCYLDAGYRTTSATGYAISKGSKVFTLDAAAAFVAGDRVRISSAGDQTNFMEGLVLDYTAPDLQVAVDDISGAGTFASWNVNRCAAVPLSTGTDGRTAGYGGTFRPDGPSIALFPCGVSLARLGYEFFGYSPGNTDLPSYFRLMVNGSPAGPRVNLPTPAELVGDFAADGFLVDETHTVNLVAGDEFWMEWGIQFPEDAAPDPDWIGSEGYPALFALTIGAPFPDVIPPDPPVPPRYRTQLAVN